MLRRTRGVVRARRGVLGAFCLRRAVSPPHLVGRTYGHGSVSAGHRPVCGFAKPFSICTSCSAAQIKNSRFVLSLLPAKFLERILNGVMFASNGTVKINAPSARLGAGACDEG